EISMRQRLAAMPKCDNDRKVVAVTPEGTVAMIVWAVPQDIQIQAVALPTPPAATSEPLYRPREREPRAIHALAPRRLVQPLVVVDGDRRRLVEFSPPAALLEEAQARAPHVGAGPLSANQLGTEVRRAVIRPLRRRVSELDTSAFENLCAALLERMGMRDVRVAKRSKEGPLYLARQRRGVSDLRAAVKLVRGGREIGRADVQELRKDLAHYS